MLARASTLGRMRRNRSHGRALDALNDFHCNDVVFDATHDAGRWTFCGISVLHPATMNQ
jgi:hypothetical protein